MQKVIVEIKLFFNVRIVSKSPAELSPPIGAFMELYSNANLPCLLYLAHCVSIGIPIHANGTHSHRGMYYRLKLKMYKTYL